MEMAYRQNHPSGSNSSLGDSNPGLGDSNPSQDDKAKAREATGVTNEVMSASANLAQLLPSGTVLAFQSLSSSFTNQGFCYVSNWWLSIALVTLLTSSCIFFAFTDSIVYEGKVYYGIAMPDRLNLFNLSRAQEKKLFPNLHPHLSERCLNKLDVLHAIFTAVVFLTVAANDVGLQNCFFPHASDDVKQLLKNMPLGMAVLSSFVFMIFPTTRRGIGSHFETHERSTAPNNEKDNRAQGTTTSGNTNETDMA